MPIEFVVSSTRRVYNVTVAGHVASGVMFVREAVVELLSNRDGLPTLKVWRQSFARTGFEPIPADRPLAPC